MRGGMWTHCRRGRLFPGAEFVLLARRGGRDRRVGTSGDFFSGRNW